MLTKLQVIRLKASVDRLVKDAVAESWAGSKPPEEAEAIRESFKNAKKDFQSLIVRYTILKRTP